MCFSRFFPLQKDAPCCCGNKSWRLQRSRSNLKGSKGRYRARRMDFWAFFRDCSLFHSMHSIYQSEKCVTLFWDSSTFFFSFGTTLSPVRVRSWVFLPSKILENPQTCVRGIYLRSSFSPPNGLRLSSNSCSHFSSNCNACGASKIRRFSRDQSTRYPPTNLTFLQTEMDKIQRNERVLLLVWQKFYNTVVFGVGVVVVVVVVLVLLQL